MKIDQALSRIQTLGMDTSPFIYLIEKHPLYKDRVLAIFEQVETGAIQVITSILTLTEVLTMPVAKKHVQYISEYRQMLLNTQFITSIRVDEPIAERAAVLRLVPS